jgi:hypothetical protein
LSLKASRTALWIAALGLLAACSRYPESEYPPKPPPGVTAPEDDAAPPPPGAVWRKDVNTVLDEGLGRFLQKVALEPELQQGAFLGFRVVELRPPSWWQGVDIQPGDVVTLVNGMPIEQPTEAHAAFESLRKSDKLTVKYLRGGEARELSYRIMDKPTAQPAEPAVKPAEPVKPAS